MFHAVHIQEILVLYSSSAWLLTSRLQAAFLPAHPLLKSVLASGCVLIMHSLEFAVFCFVFVVAISEETSSATAESSTSARGSRRLKRGKLEDYEKTY